MALVAGFFVSLIILAIVGGLGYTYVTHDLTGTVVGLFLAAILSLWYGKTFTRINEKRREEWD